MTRVLVRDPWSILVSQICTNSVSFAITGESCCTQVLKNMSCNISYADSCMGCVLKIGPAIMVDLDGIPNSLEGINSGGPD